MLVNWYTVLRGLATSDLKNAFHVLYFYSQSDLVL